MTFDVVPNPTFALSVVPTVALVFKRVDFAPRSEISLPRVRSTWNGLNWTIRSRVRALGRWETWCFDSTLSQNEENSLKSLVFVLERRVRERFGSA